MHIILFFTYKVQIKDWIESGIFKREVQLYEKLANKGYKITFLTYDKEIYNNLIDESGINHIPLFKNIKEPSSKLIYFIKSFLILYKSSDIFRDADIFKTNQLLGSWIPIIAKLFYRKKLIVRTGYDLFEFTLKNKKGVLKKILYYFLTQFAILISDLYTVSSKSDEKLIIKRFFFARNKIKVRNNWVTIPETGNINERFDNINWDIYYSDLPFNQSALSLYRWAPIADELKVLDRKIVLNSMILKWDVIKQEFQNLIQF